MRVGGRIAARLVACGSLQKQEASSASACEFAYNLMYDFIVLKIN